jgi:hypothetical protein
MDTIVRTEWGMVSLVSLFFLVGSSVLSVDAELCSRCVSRKWLSVHVVLDSKVHLLECCVHRTIINIVCSCLHNMMQQNMSKEQMIV